MSTIISENTSQGLTHRELALHRDKDPLNGIVDLRPGFTALVRDHTPVRSQQPALYPEGSSVTKNIYPSLRKEVQWNSDAYDRIRRRTLRINRLRLVLLGQERFELYRVSTMRTILQGTYVLEIRLLEFSLESFIPALVHGILLEVIDRIDNLISSRGNRFLIGGFDNSCHLLAIGVLGESAAFTKWVLRGGIPLGDLPPFLCGHAGGRRGNFSSTPLEVDAKYCIQCGLHCSTRRHDGGCGETCVSSARG